jgi:hypothetical protein
MSAARVVLAFVVVFSVLSCPTVRGSQVGQTSATRVAGLTSCQPPPSTVRILYFEPARPRTASHFSQWRYRLKSVLVETTDPRLEEFDLGPAVITSRLISISPLELMSRRFQTVHPLRC